ncbi:alpha/beta hydrolase [Pseudohongiella sp.]|uniref:Esterase n=1 Tax=marine sediment metagenome TaxID=412755 RepID=A0A0F9W6E7_9ZZZZ|nr:alpha/beta hydrolase-fold protein [Pseudohongiella sp.]HDZ08085.1 esterase family protein [Pseudohongiella sp.]HEA63053.1 esterase family protein [Pseudohongiella sp.]
MSAITASSMCGTLNVRPMSGVRVSMHRLALLVLLVMGCWLAPAIALAGTVTHHSFSSATLGREYSYNLYTPEAYHSSPASFPVLYLLHGAAGDEHSWVDAGRVQATVDALIEESRVPPMLIVMPADPNFWWADSLTESAQTALITELIPHIDDNYRSIDAREGRLIAGYSAGGFGTVNAALTFPGLFAAAAALSPAVYDPVPPASSSATRIAIFQRDGEFDPALWRSMNWVSVFDDYKQSGVIVPFYINSGDHDRFDIAYHAAGFYQALREHQADSVELRIFDGDHDFAAWGGSLGDALQYISGFLAPAH